MHRTLTALLLMICLSLPARAQVERERLNRDLRIMEDVLRTLLSPEAAPAGNWGPLPGPRVRGLYLQGHGVLFLAEAASAPGPVHAVRLVRAGGADHKDTLEIHKVAADTSGVQHREKIRERLGEFFTTYAGAIGQLRDDERITVLVHPQKSGPTFHLEDEEVVFSPAPQVPVPPPPPDSGHKEFARRIEKKKLILHCQPGGPCNVPGHDHTDQSLLEVSARAGDVLAHRQGRLSAPELRQRLTFHQRQEDQDKHIDIMAGILDQVLGGGGGPQWGGGTSGARVEGLGILFFVEVERFPGPGAFMPGEGDRDHDREYVEKLKAELVETVGDYGPTLRTLQSGERLIVELRLRFKPFLSGAPTHLLLDVPREQIDAYSQGKIDLESFRRKVRWSEL